jgi:transposase InsO family protein
MNESLKPKDPAEAVALFRAQVIGPLLCREYDSHGELAEALRELAAEPVRPPGYNVTRYFAVSTLERWYYAFRKGGIEALRPQGRASGYALMLDEAQRKLLLDIRREHPQVSTALILRTLERDGRLARGAVSEPTLRRLYAAHGLDRRTLAAGDRQPRRRWEAAAPNLLWHTDVCHGPALRVDGRAVPLRIHALLDDHSRYVVAIQACSTERESEMLALVVKAMRLHGAPDVIYADNGPTYVGEALATACGRLGVGLVHAKPYDPQARGKMERFWRTLREQCLDHLAGLGSLHDAQVRLIAYLDRHYHVTPHSSLLGKTPAEVYETGRREPLPDAMLSEALVVRGRRRVRRDGTVSIAGTDFEVKQGFLAGRTVTIGRSLLVPTDPPWLEHEDQRHVLERVEPTRRGRRRPAPRVRRGIDAVPFDPPGALNGLSSLWSEKSVHPPPVVRMQADISPSGGA